MNIGLLVFPRLKPGARLKFEALSLSLARCFSAGTVNVSGFKLFAERAGVR
jgi:hypothetical protein